MLIVSRHGKSTSMAVSLQEAACCSSMSLMISMTLQVQHYGNRHHEYVYSISRRWIKEIAARHVMAEADTFSSEPFACLA